VGKLLLSGSFPAASLVVSNDMHPSGFSSPICSPLLIHSCPTTSTPRPRSYFSMITPEQRVQAQALTPDTLALKLGFEVGQDRFAYRLEDQLTNQQCSQSCSHQAPPSFLPSEVTDLLPIFTTFASATFFDSHSSGTSTRARGPSPILLLQIMPPTSAFFAGPSATPLSSSLPLALQSLKARENTSSTNRVSQPLSPVVTRVRLPSVSICRNRSFPLLTKSPVQSGKPSSFPFR
jgi:hypothetical protein